MTTNDLPTIFISHSTSTLAEDDYRVRLRNELVEKLKCTGWNVFIDYETIEPGQAWRKEILYNLATASAGIVLIDELALKSKWVNAELMILSYRHSTNPDFPFIPIFLPGISRNATELEKYAPFDFGEIQRHDLHEEDMSDPSKCADKITSLKSLTRTFTTKCEDPRWVKNVVSLIRRIHQLSVMEVANKLQIKTSSGGDFDEHLRWSVAMCMHISEKAACLSALAIFAEELVKDDAQKLTELVVRKFLSNEAVERISIALRHPDRHGWILMQPSSLNISRKYVRRVEMEMAPKESTVIYTSVPAPDGDYEDPSDLIFLVEKEISKKFSHPPDTTPMVDDNLSRVVTEILEQSFTYGACILPSQFHREDVIFVLRKKYPKLIFITYSTEEFSVSDSSAVSLQKYLIMSPENDYWLYHRKCFDIFEKYHRSN